jgi:hypothetical protein
MKSSKIRQMLNNVPEVTILGMVVYLMFTRKGEISPEKTV